MHVHTSIVKFIATRTGATVLAAAAVGSVWIAAALADRLVPRRVHRIHIELFRYGTEPYVIRARRGDRVELTFSTRDTGHSFFLQEYGIDAKVTPGTDIVELFDPNHPERLPRRVRQVALATERPGFWARWCSKARFRCHV